MKSKIISTILSISVIALLFILGPAHALILGISVSDTSPFLGEIINFLVSAEIESGESIDVDDYLTLELKGPQTTKCKFSLKGEPLSSCIGINITLVSSPDFENGYGYGYGYGYGVNNFTSGKFVYKIDLDTSYYKPWFYHTKLIVNSKVKDYEKVGPDITITKKAAKIQGCSVRSIGGEFFVLGQNLTDGTKVNFNIPIRNSANDGQGYIISQTRKGRFTYKFDFIKVLDADEEGATLLTSGSYRNGPGKLTKTSAVLVLDKDHNLVDIHAEEFSLDDSKVKFLRRC